MNKIKKKLLAIINILAFIILSIILLLSDLSENTMYIMIMTLIIGWAIPYTVLLITGLALIYQKHPKLTLVFNIVNILLCIMIISLSIYLYDSKMLIFIIEYSIIGIISIINCIHYILYIRKHPQINFKKEEYNEIKKIKEKNNGAIV